MVFFLSRFLREREKMQWAAFPFFFPLAIDSVIFLKGACSSAFFSLERWRNERVLIHIRAQERWRKEKRLPSGVHDRRAGV